MSESETKADEGPVTQIEPQRSSSDIVAKTAEVRANAAAAAEKKKAAQTDDDSKAADDDLRRDLDITDHKIGIDACVAKHGGNISAGLTTAEANVRLERDGKNQLTPPPKDPEWLKFFRELTGFFSLLLWVGAGLCFLAYGVKKEADNLYLGLTLAIVVFFTGCFSYVQNRKSEDLMASFKNMMQPEIAVMRDGSKTTISTLDLVKGDLVFLVQGNKVPADVLVIDCTDNAAVDNSSLTGEAEPQKRSADCTHEAPLETRNLAFFGTSLVEGSMTGMVIACGDGTVMGRIAALATSTEDNQTPINKEIEHFVHIVSAVAMVLGVSFFIVGVAIKTDYLDNLVFVIGIIVANVPEGLLATVTVCLTLTANRMHGKQVMVKKLEGVETLGSTSCICSDKTGTLTQNIMTVREIMFDDQCWSVDDFAPPQGWNNEQGSEDGDNAALDSPMHRPSFQALQRCATLCNTTEFDQKTKEDANGNPIPFKVMKTLGDGTQMEVVAWDAIGDASETAMVKFCQDKRDIMNYRAAWKIVGKIPFNSSNKYQVHVEQPAEGGDNWVFMKGAPERVLERCDTALIEGEEVELTDELRASIAQHQHNLSKQGYRVLGFSEKHLDAATYPADYHFNTENPNFPLGNRNVNMDVSPTPDLKAQDGLCYVGMMALIDPPRPQVPGAVAKCKTAGIKVIMVTGDHPVTAKAIAHQVGILWGDTKDEVNERNAEAGLSQGDAGWEDPLDAPAIVVPGWEISVDTPQSEWDFILDHRQIVFARTSPQQKLLIVEHCQNRREVVAVTGDGVNDSPALKKADIGVAMGITGSEVSKEAADMILLDDNFASIVSGVEEGRLIFDNLKKSIAYTLSSNIPEISPFLCFITLQTPLPLSTVLILAVDLGTDMIPAISMAYEKAESDIMKRPPRNAEVDRLVTKKLVSFAYLQIGVIQAAAGFFTWMVVLNDYGYPPHLLMGLGLGDYWGKQPLYCKFDGGSWVNENGVATTTVTPLTGPAPTDYPLWYEADTGDVTECAFPLKNFRGSSDNTENYDWDEPQNAGETRYTNGWTVITKESIDALEAQGYYEYVPYKARKSPFWDSDWLSYNINDDEVPGLGDAVDLVHYSYQPVGQWSIAAHNLCSTSIDNCRMNEEVTATGDAKDLAKDFDVNGVSLGEDKYRYATLTTDTLISCGANNDEWCQNVASRMAQKEALHHAQGAFFVCIVVVQWADLLICRTRWLSIRSQGMGNSTLNFGLFFETLLAAWLCYIPAINRGLGTRNLRLSHWIPGMPFSMIILMYDECRKYLMRTTSITHIDKTTGRSVRDPGWLEANTYY